MILTSEKARTALESEQCIENLDITPSTLLLFILDVAISASSCTKAHQEAGAITSED
jgi:hypothetical protein